MVINHDDNMLSEVVFKTYGGNIHLCRKDNSVEIKKKKKKDADPCA